MKVSELQGRELLHRVMHEVPSAAEVRGLLEAGADPDRRDNNGMTVLMHAVVNGLDDVVPVLIAGKAQVCARSGGGLTAITAAAWRGSMKAAAALIAAGADVNAAAPVDGRTPLMAAVMQGHAEMARLLVCRGARLDARDNGGKTAAEIALIHGYANLLDGAEIWLFEEGFRLGIAAPLPAPAVLRPRLRAAR